MPNYRWLAYVLMLQATALPAQVAVSANDGKARPLDAPDALRTADSIAVLDLGTQPAKLLATLPVPATLVGPPASVALSRNAKLAVVTAAQQLDAAGAAVPADIVSVIDLADPRRPRVVQTVHAAPGAAGVAINPAGSLALVANTNADSLSVFRIASGRLSPVGTVSLGARRRPVDVAFSADGHAAYVVAQGANSLIRLAIQGEHVTRAGDDIALSAQPYSLALDRRRHVAYVTNLGGRASSAAPGPKPGSIAIVDLRAGRMVGQVDTGVTPEHVGLSPSGRFLEATINNGTTAPRGSPAHHDRGLMIIYRANGIGLDPVAQTESGQWCQGAVWSRDEKRILLQCAGLKQIEAYRFDGRVLTRDDQATLQLDARPGAIATAFSR